jgi:hypothetical protein
MYTALLLQCHLLFTLEKDPLFISVQKGKTITGTPANFLWIGRLASWAGTSAAQARHD